MKKLRVLCEKKCCKLYRNFFTKQWTRSASTWVEFYAALLWKILSQRLLECVSTAFSLLRDLKLCIFPCLTHKPNCCRWDFIRTIRGDEIRYTQFARRSRCKYTCVRKEKIEKSMSEAQQRVRDWVMKSFNDYNDPQSRNFFVFFPSTHAIVPSGGQAAIMALKWMKKYLFRNSLQSHEEGNGMRDVSRELKLIHL